MNFDVGSNTYRLRVTEGPIELDGAECLSACVQAEREILISKEAKPRDRMRLLIRELARAWTFETGEPSTFNGWLGLVATVTLAAVKNLNTQGGEMGVLSLRPGEVTSSATVKIGLSLNRPCAVCNTTVAGGSIVCQPAGLPGVVEMMLYCDFCGHTQCWKEMQGARGLPTGVPIGKPTFERGDKTGLTLVRA
jgi:hypothetical protein